MADLYGVLGVQKSASADEIKKSYRKIARDNHPDVNDDPAAEERFKQASHAFEVLSNPEKRKLYDEFGDEGIRSGFDPEKARAYRQWQGGGFSGGGFGGFRRASGANGFGGYQEVHLEDLFDMFGGGFDGSQGAGGFRAHRPVQRPGADIEAEIHLDLRDAVLGTERELTFRGPGGSPRTLKVKIPVGIDDGQTIRLNGQGEPGWGGSPAGSLLLRVRINPHPLLERSGRDLTLSVPVTVPEALRGGPIEVPTFHGTVTVKVPPGSQNGTKLRLRGKGVVPKKGAAGDLYVELSVRLPKGAPELVLSELEGLYDGDVRCDLHI